MEYVKWFHYLLYKFKRHSKLHLNSRTIKNFLTLALRYLKQFCNFYIQLSLQTIFSALKLTKICCININISFLEFNHKLFPPLLLTYQTWKYSHNLTRYESGIQIFQLFCELREIWKYRLSQHSTINISSISWIGKDWEVQLEQH